MLTLISGCKHLDWLLCWLDLNLFLSPYTYFKFDTAMEVCAHIVTKVSILEEIMYSHSPNSKAITLRKWLRIVPPSTRTAIILHFSSFTIRDSLANCQQPSHQIGIEMVILLLKASMRIPSPSHFIFHSRSILFQCSLFLFTPPPPNLGTHPDIKIHIFL